MIEEDTKLEFGTDRDEEWKVSHKETSKAFRMEGLGTCEVHHCDLWGSIKPVLSWNKERTEQREIYVRVCPNCQAEGVKQKTNIAERERNYIEEFRTKKGIDLNLDTIVKYDYADSMSVVNTDNMVKWIVEKIGKQKKVKLLSIRKYIQLTENRYSSDEMKSKFLKQSHDIEQADLLIFDSLADFSDKEAEKVINVLYSIKDTASIMMLTIPTSDARLEQLPAKLKFRFEKAQVMQMSSTGKQR